MLATADAIALCGIVIPVGGIVIVGILRMAPRMNGKYVRQDICVLTTNQIKESLKRIEESVKGIHERLDT